MRLGELLQLSRQVCLHLCISEWPPGMCEVLRLRISLAAHTPSFIWTGLAGFSEGNELCSCLLFQVLRGLVGHLASFRYAPAQRILPYIVGNSEALGHQQVVVCA